MHTSHLSGAAAARTAALLALLAAVPLVGAALDWRPLLDLDGNVAVRLHGLALEHPSFTQSQRILSDWIWDPWTMRLLLAGGVVLLLRRGELARAAWVAAAAVLGAVVQQALKTVVGRPRPRWLVPVDSAEYAAMPSGHAMTAALTFVLLIWVVRGAAVRNAAVVVAAVSVVGVCFTRLVLGVHWLSDTVAGALLGGALGFAAVAAWAAARRAAREVNSAAGGRG
ncbi:phosphatase PAP2 family protein [Streptomyces sulphureus]|uniref:phosphatase PAP2 family protein n=1 Tax=Streptomyces sulphureus TaxID=47758 RepID=UPI0003710905|nr:phosphatase PAP2 family protein [Streptomyces sulphureus]